MKKLPETPKWPLWFLRFFCTEERVEEIEGDLYELHQRNLEEKGLLRARILYSFMVIKCLRSFALKGFLAKNLKTSFFHLFKSNLIISWRQLGKNRTITAINAFGLSIGLATFIILIQIVQYELGFNKHFEDKDRIYRVYSTWPEAENMSVNPGVSYGVPDFVLENIPGIETSAYFFGQSMDVRVPKGEALEYFNCDKLTFADENYFRVFDQYDWIEGSPETSLSEPRHVVLTDDRAIKYFGHQDFEQMLGRIIYYDDSISMSVSGIVRLETHLTDFKFTDFLSPSTIGSGTNFDDWMNNGSFSGTQGSSQFWIKLETNLDPLEFQPQLTILEDHVNGMFPERSKRAFAIQPLSDLHSNQELGTFNYMPVGVDLTTIKVITAISFGILLLAMFNFINLETANSLTKVKEVGMRRVLGSNQNQLIIRFLFGSVLTSLITIIPAILLMWLGVRYFQDYFPSGLEFDFFSLNFMAFLVGSVLLVGVLAGLYPAFSMTRIKTASSLKNQLSTKGTTSNLIVKRTLIITQFVFAQLLVISTLIFLKQLDFLDTKELGFKQSDIIIIHPDDWPEDPSHLTFLNQLRTIPELIEISEFSRPVAQNGYSTVKWKYFSQGIEKEIEAHKRSGDEKFFDFFNIGFLAGMKLNTHDSKEILVNKTFTKALGFEHERDAIGFELSRREKTYTIAGVVDDFHFQPLHHKIKPLYYRYEPLEAFSIGAKIHPDQSVPEVVEKISSAWEDVYDSPLDLEFFDQEIRGFYEAERKTFKLVNVASALAILISALGVLGLISLTVVQKTKELGIRQILGASIYNLGKLLSKEYFLLISISFLLVIFPAVLLARNWLENFAYSIDLSWWIFALGFLICLGIGFFAVIFRIFASIRRNPVEALRYE